MFKKKRIDDERFERVVRGHQAMVFSICLRIVNDRALAEDTAQEVFLQLYRTSDRFDSSEHITAWLRRTSVHRAIDALRRRRARPEAEIGEFDTAAAAEREGDPLLQEMIKQMIFALPENARAVMVMRYQEDLDPADIAKTLGMPVATVKSHLKRSLAQLRESLHARKVSKR